MVKDFGVVGVQNLNHRSRVLRLTAASKNVLLSANSPSFQSCYTYSNKGQSFSWISMLVHVLVIAVCPCPMPIKSTQNWLVLLLQRGKTPDIEGLTSEHFTVLSPFGCRIISKAISAHHDI